MDKCVVCGKPYTKEDWDQVRKDFCELIDQVNMYGAESLTECQQTLIISQKCHSECYETLLVRS